MGILPTCSRVSTTVWLHHLKLNGEKVCWELHKNAECCFEQISIAVAYKIATVWPLASHLINYPSKMIKTYWALLLK